MICCLTFLFAPFSISIPLFFVFYLGYKIIKRTKHVKLSEMDFVTGRRELDELDVEQEALYGDEYNGWWGKVKGFLF